MEILMDDFVRFGIPMNEYRLPDKKEYRGLLFVVHDFMSSKDHGLGLLPKRIAELGYKVVALDAYKHGMRKEPPFTNGLEIQKKMAMLEVVNQTALDIKFLYDNFYRNEFDNVGVIGVSMGGMVAFQMPRIMEDIKCLVSFNGTPDMKALFHDRGYKHMMKDLSDQEKEVAEEYFEKLDLSDYMERYDSIHIFATNGKNDVIVNKNSSKSFFNTLDASDNRDVTQKIYRANHELTEDMINDVLVWLSELDIDVPADAELDSA